MTSVAIVASTGNSIFDRVLRGIYGTTSPGSRPGTVMFKPAPEFTRVSPHLFSQMPQLPVREQDIKLREIDDAEAGLATAQILFGLGARWANLYDSRTGLRQDEPLNFGQVMLAGEANQVASGVRDHLSSLGMQVFEVPVLIKGEVMSNGAYISSAFAMMDNMRPDRTIEVDPDRPARALGTSALTGQAEAVRGAREAAAEAAVQAAVAATQPQPVPVAQSGIRAWLNSLVGNVTANGEAGAANEQAAENAGPVAEPAAVQGDAADDAGAGERTEQGPAWAKFQGIGATLRGTVYVVAPNAEAAPRALHYMLQAHHEDGAALHLEPGDVVSVRDLQLPELAISEFEDDDDGYGDRP